MNYVRLGRTGVLVSEVALGTMTLGNESDETVLDGVILKVGRRFDS